MKNFALIYLAVVGLAGCQTAVLPKDTTNTSVVVKKPNEPMMCTMQYDPVCGKVAGNNGVFSYKTYSNACVAKNSNDNVVSYTNGGCDRDLKK